MTAPSQQPNQGQPAQSGQTDQPQNQGQPDPGQGQQGQFPNQGQQQPVNPWAGLFDVTPGQGQPGQQPGQQQGQPQWPNQQQPAWPTPPPAAPAFDQQQLVDLVGRAVQSAVDRRVNQFTNPQWQQAHGQAPQGQPGQQQGQGGQQQPAWPGYPPPSYPVSPVPSGPSDADRREARMAAREYLGDQIQFGSDAERAMAVELTAATVETQLVLGMTPNQAGMAAAQTVAQRVTALRRSYEDQAVRTLRARGLLVEPAQMPAGMSAPGLPQGGVPVTTANQQQTAAKVNKLAAWAAEENAQRGWNKPAAGAAAS